MSGYGMNLLEWLAQVTIWTCIVITLNMYIVGEEVVTALGSEVDRLEMEIQELVPGIRHVDIEAHNPIIPSPDPRSKGETNDNI